MLMTLLSFLVAAVPNCHTGNTPDNVSNCKYVNADGSTQASITVGSTTIYMEVYP